MANEQNLIPFKKGQSGNPNGRPKGSKAFKTILNDYLSRNISIKDPTTKESTLVEVREALMIKLIGHGMNGSLHAIKEIRDMVDGPIKQSIEIEDKNIERPIAERVDEIIKRIDSLNADKKQRKK